MVKVSIGLSSSSTSNIANKLKRIGTGSLLTARFEDGI